MTYKEYREILVEHIFLSFYDLYHLFMYCISSYH